MSWLLILIAFVAFVAISHVVESLRRAPPTPDNPAWIPECATYDFVDADGLRLRRLKTGEGRPLLLLHTLRTQMELFRDVIPELATEFEVHAIDFPGHGYAEIPGEAHTPELFARACRGYLATAGLHDVVIVGESIGGAIGLLLAAENNMRVAQVVAINAYDYGGGRGILRGSVLSWMLFSLPRIPILGASVWRLRWHGIFAEVIKGSVHDPDTLPKEVVDEMHKVGNRPGHLAAFLSLIAHFAEWEALRAHYPAIALPVTLVYGEHDWSRPRERDANSGLIPGAGHKTVPGCGHLMSFEKPEAVIAAVRQAVRADT